MRLSGSLQRFFDLIFSMLGLIILVPFFVPIILCMLIFQGFPVFYIQQRVGYKGKMFGMFKLRTMRKNADKLGLSITVGGRDPRITPMGYWLRRFKIDELPQLINVFLGNMSFVGPRPEVERYVSLYSEEQRIVLTVKPGITDWASIEYKSENELLGESANPEKTYIEEILPAKIALNLKFVKNPTVKQYFQIIWKTVF